MFLQLNMNLYSAVNVIMLRVVFSLMFFLFIETFEQS